MDFALQTNELINDNAVFKLSVALCTVFCQHICQYCSAMSQYWTADISVIIIKRQCTLLNSGETVVEHTEFYFFVENDCAFTQAKKFNLSFAYQE